MFLYNNAAVFVIKTVGFLLFKWLFNSLILFIGPNVYLLVKDKLTSKQIVLYSFATIMLGGILTLTIGKISPFVFVLTFLPITFSNSFLRSFSANILLGQKEMNAGAASSMISFSNTGIGAFGMVLAALPWANYIVGLGVIAVVAMILSFTLIFIFFNKKYQLSGF